MRALAAEFLRKPLLAIFAPISTRRREVFALLDGLIRPDLLADLYLIAGRLTALLAHASADLGRPFAAEAHARTAWMCADLAGNNPLRVCVRWVQSNIMYWNGDYVSVAEVARQGEAYATSGTSLIRLASQQARAVAVLGDASAVQRALTTTQHARDNFTPDSVEVGVFIFNPGKSAYYAAEARLARRYDYIWVRLGKSLPWVATQQVSTHWLRHTTLTWVERTFGYAVARAFAGHNGRRDTGTTATYVRADVYEVALALATLTGEPHPLASPVAGARTREDSAHTIGR